MHRSTSEDSHGNVKLFLKARKKPKLYTNIQKVVWNGFKKTRLHYPVSADDGGLVPDLPGSQPCISADFNISLVQFTPSSFA
jgi:hypothetical protein